MWYGRYTQFKPGWNIKMDFAVMRALTSDHCGPGSNAGVNAMCGLILSLVLVLPAPNWEFSLGTLWKTNTNKVLPNLEHTNTFQQVLKNSLVLCG